MVRVGRLQIFTIQNLYAEFGVVDGGARHNNNDGIGDTMSHDPIAMAARPREDSTGSTDGEFTQMQAPAEPSTSLVKQKRAQPSHSQSRSQSHSDSHSHSHSHSGYTAATKGQ